MTTTRRTRAKTWRASGEHAGLSPSLIIDAGIELIGASGVDALSMSRLAAELGVSQPALYSHFAGMQSLYAAITARANDMLVASLNEALDTYPRDPMYALVRGNRDYVRRFPDLYLFQVRGTRDPAPERAVLQQEHAAEGAEVVLRALQACGLSRSDARDMAFAIRAALHGFASLEARARAVGADHLSNLARAALDWDPDGDRQVQAFVQLLSNGVAARRHR
jgi:AcrR family transcriptional regulator